MKRKKGRCYKLKGEAEIARIERRLARMLAKQKKAQGPPPPPAVQQDLFLPPIPQPLTEVRFFER